MAKQIRLHPLNIPVGQWARKDMLSARRSNGIPTQAEATALFDKWTALGVSASASRQTIVNETIYYLKQAGIWDELDCLFMWTAHSQTAALVDWKNPTTRTATVTNDYAGAFVADSYLKGNGTNFRVNLGYNPGDGGTYKFTQNSASMGVYVVDRVAEVKRDISALNGSTQGNELEVIGVASTVYTYVNSATQRTGKNFMGAGLSAVKRTSSTTGNSVASQGYYNATAYTDASMVVPNIPFYAFCRNVNGTFSTYTTRKQRYLFCGSKNIDFFSINNIIEEYYLSEIATVPVKRVTLSGNSFTATGDYVERFLANINMYSTIDLNSQGNSGYTTPQCKTIADTYIFPYIKNTITTDVYFIWELTNDMAANSGNATICYNNLVTYCQAVRTSMPNAKIVVATMLPRNSQPNRQNDADLYDDTTLNGKIRNHLVQDGYADSICDVGSDMTMGQEGQNTNTTYYEADQLHPKTVGYQYLADNYITPAINAYL